ncbi:MAG: serine hydrolase domain-containing protein [Acidobacteriaceae bacterium]
MSRFPSAHAILIEAIRDRAFPGAAYGVLSPGQGLTAEAAGAFTYETGAPPVKADTIFDIASISKVLPTTAMAMLLFERHILDLDEPVCMHLSEFVHAEAANSPKRTITPRMLLTHSSGLPAYERLYERYHSASALLNACMQMPLEALPGTHAMYSDIGFIVLGYLLEKLAGETLDAFACREIFLPLGMTSTTFRPPAEWKPLIPPTRLDDPLRHRLIQGEVHDDNCWVLGGVSGHAGAFSNVADTLRFARYILDNGTPLFREATVSMFAARQTQPPGTSRALGWDTPSAPSSSGHFFSACSVGHLGYTGTSLWIDLEKAVAIVLLTNRTFPGAGPDGVSQKIQQVRPRFHDAIMRELKVD